MKRVESVIPWGLALFFAGGAAWVFSANPFSVFVLGAVFAVHCAAFILFARFKLRTFFGAWFLFVLGNTLFFVSRVELFVFAAAIAAFFDYLLLRDFIDRAHGRVSPHRAVWLGFFLLFTTATSSFGGIFLQPLFSRVLLVLFVLIGSSFVTAYFLDLFLARSHVSLPPSARLLILCVQALVTGELFVAFTFVPLHHGTLGALLACIDGSIKYVSLQALVQGFGRRTFARAFALSGIATAVLLASFFFSLGA